MSRNFEKTKSINEVLETFREQSEKSFKEAANKMSEFGESINNHKFNIFSDIDINNKIGGNKIMRVMISQPMNNKSSSIIRKEREDIIKKFKELHIEVLDTIIEETADPKVYNEYHPSLFYIAKSIDFMAQVDAVYFMDGWKDARGCRIEYAICLEYGIKILDSNFFNIKILDSGFSNIDSFKRYTNKPKTLLCNNVNDNFEQLDLFEGLDNHIPRID